MQPIFKFKLEDGTIVTGANPAEALMNVKASTTGKSLDDKFKKEEQGKEKSLAMLEFEKLYNEYKELEQKIKSGEKIKKPMEPIVESKALEVKIEVPEETTDGKETILIRDKQEDILDMDKLKEVSPATADLVGLLGTENVAESVKAISETLENNFKTAEEYRKALVENQAFFNREDARYYSTLSFEDGVKFKNQSKEKAIEQLVSAFKPSNEDEVTKSTEKPETKPAKVENSTEEHLEDLKSMSAEKLFKVVENAARELTDSVSTIYYILSGYSIGGRITKEQNSAVLKMINEKYPDGDKVTPIAPDKVQETKQEIEKIIDSSKEIKKDIEQLTAQQIKSEVEKIIKQDFVKKLEENKLEYKGMDILVTKSGFNIVANFEGDWKRGSPKFIADIVNDNGKIKIINHKLKANPLVSVLAPKNKIDAMAESMGENIKQYIEKDRKKEIERLDIENGILKVTYKS